MHAVAIVPHQPVQAGWSALIDCDYLIADWFQHHLNPDLAGHMQQVTTAGSALCIGGMTTLLLVLLVWRRAWYGLLALVLTVPCGALLGECLKLLVGRPRPSAAGPFEVWSGYSFPSGHTIAATLLYGFLALQLAATLRDSRWRWLPFILAMPLVAGVGFSRIALGAHYLSDVLAALTLGTIWLAVSQLGVGTLRRRLNPMPPAAAEPALVNPEN